MTYTAYAFTWQRKYTDHTKLSFILTNNGQNITINSERQQITVKMQIPNEEFDNKNSIFQNCLQPQG
jgi:hypothetical protein